MPHGERYVLEPQAVQLIEQYGIPYPARGLARDAEEAGQLLMLLQLGLLNHGIWVPYRGELAVSTPMTEREIDQAANAVGHVLQVLKPYVEDMAPHLLLSQ